MSIGPQKASIVTRWRSDGREILYFALGGRTVMSIPATPSPDGQKFYACVANQTFSRGLIRVVKNWATGLDEAK